MPREESRAAEHQRAVDERQDSRSAAERGREEPWAPADWPRRTRVLVAEGHALVREGLRGLLEARGVEVVGLARTGREAVRLARELRPDVVLMDTAMPEMGGLEATRLITTDLPEVKVVILTASQEDSDFLGAIRSGAKGYLLKDIAPGRLFELLEGVARGEPALAPTLAFKLLEEIARAEAGKSGSGPELTGLTARERQVLELLACGVTSNRELAKRLVVSESTISYHLRNIMDKLHLRSRAQVVSYTVRHRLADGRQGSL